VCDVFVVVGVGAVMVAVVIPLRTVTGAGVTVVNWVAVVVLKNVVVVVVIVIVDVFQSDVVVSVMVKVGTSGARFLSFFSRRRPTARRPRILVKSTETSRLLILGLGAGVMRAAAGAGIAVRLTTEMAVAL